jgi:hypothetical protein
VGNYNLDARISNEVKPEAKNITSKVYKSVEAKKDMPRPKTSQKSKSKPKSKKVPAMNRSNNSSKPKSRLHYICDKKARSGKISPVCKKDTKLNKLGLRKHKSYLVKVGFKSKNSKQEVAKIISKKLDEGSISTVQNALNQTKPKKSNNNPKVGQMRKSQDYEETESILDIKRAHSKSHKAYKGNMTRCSVPVSTKNSIERSKMNFNMLSYKSKVTDYENLVKQTQKGSKNLKFLPPKVIRGNSDSNDELCNLDFMEASEGKGHVTPRVNTIKSIKAKYSSTQ